MEIFFGRGWGGGGLYEIGLFLLLFYFFFFFFFFLGGGGGVISIHFRAF